MDFNLANVTAGISAEKPPERHEKILILGSGPAGLSAALYAARADLAPTVLAGMELGGQVSLTYTVENYPGFPEGLGGSELVDRFQKQAERFGAKIEFDSAVKVDFMVKPFQIKTYNGEYKADSIIVATGASPNKLKVPGEVEFTGKGVSYCATCDGWFFKDKNVLVVGGGDSALEEALFLTRYAQSVTVVHRRDSLRAGAILQKRAIDNPKISFLWNSKITEINGQETVNSVRIENVVTGEKTEELTDGVFIFIGHSPNTQIFGDQLEMDDRGYLVVDLLMQTSAPGVFAAGEVADPIFRQVITSAGMGAAAAMRAIHYLEEYTLIGQS